MKLTASITGHGRLQADLAQFGAAPRRALDLAAEEIETYIEGQVARHNKTGKLFASIYKRRVPDGWEIGNDQQIARHSKETPIQKITRVTKPTYFSKVHNC